MGFAVHKPGCVIKHGRKKSSSLGQAFLILKAFEKVGVVLFPGPMFRALHFLTTKT
jgi:hypothetical protein